MICRFKTHQAQPSIALSRERDWNKIKYLQNSRNCTKKKIGIWISMLQIPRAGITYDHLLANSTFIFCNDSKAKALQENYHCSPHTAITGPQNWREHQRRCGCRSTSEIRLRLTSEWRWHNPGQSWWKTSKTRWKKEQEPYSIRQVQLI